MLIEPNVHFYYLHYYHLFFKEHCLSSLSGTHAPIRYSRPYQVLTPLSGTHAPIRYSCPPEDGNHMPKHVGVEYIKRINRTSTISLSTFWSLQTQKEQNICINILL
jgi:hypothetical protein